MEEKGEFWVEEIRGEGMLVGEGREMGNSGYGNDITTKKFGCWRRMKTATDCMIFRTYYIVWVAKN